MAAAIHHAPAWLCPDGVKRPNVYRRDGTSVSGQSELVCQAMREKPDIEEVQAWGTAAVRDMAAPPKDGEGEDHPGRSQQAALDQQGAMELVAAALRAHTSSARVQGRGVAALENLIHCHPERQNKCVWLGGVELVTQAMRLHPTSQEVQEFGCAALRDLAHNHEEGRAELVSLGSAELALAAMRGHPNAAMVQACGCALLGHMTLRSLDERARVLAGGAFEAVLGAMRAHPELAKVQACGCAALGNFCHDGVASAPSPQAAHEGVELVLQALQNHLEDADVQCCGCTALHNLTDDVQARARLIAVGGVAIITSTMHAHQMDVSVQACCLKVVSLLAGDGGDNALMLLEAHGTEQVVKAMQLLSDDASIQERGCKTLRIIASSSSEGQLRVASCGGIALVLAAVRSHAESSSLQSEAALYVYPMVQGNDRNRSSFVSQGGLEALLAALESFHGDAAIQHSAWLALESLSLDRVARKKFRDLGVGPKAPVCMKAFVADVDLQGCALEVLLCSPATDAEGLAEIEAADGIEVVLEAIRKHPDVEKVVSLGCDLLQKVVGRTADQAELALALRGDELVLRATLGHESSARLQSFACLALRNLAQRALPGTRARLTQQGTADRAVRALELFPENPVVQLSALTLLLALSQADGGEEPRASPLSLVEAELQALKENVSDEETEGKVIRTGQVTQLIAYSSWHGPTRMVARGCVDIVLRSLRAHPGAGEIQEAGLGLLRCFAASGRHARRRISVQGGCAVVTTAMRQFPMWTELQKQGGWIVALLARDKGRRLEEVAKLGGMELCVEALANHSEAPAGGEEEVDIEVPRACCLALEELTKGLPESQALFQKLNGLAITIHAMRVNSHSAVVVRWGLALLVALAEGTEDARTEIDTLGGLEMALGAMQAHARSLEVLEQAFVLTWLLVADSPERLTRMVLLGGVEPALKAVQLFPDDSDMQLRGCSLVNLLAGDGKEQRAELIKLGGIEMVLGAMSSQPKAVETLRVACDVLRQLAEDFVHQEKVSNAGAGASIAEAMLKNRGKNDLEIAACAALKVLVFRKPEIAKELQEQRGVEAIMKAMHKSPESLELQSKAIAALRYLAADSHTIPPVIADYSGVLLVMEALKTEAGYPSGYAEDNEDLQAEREAHPDRERDEGMQEHGLAVLTNLAWHDLENQEGIVLAEGIEHVMKVFDEFEGRRKVLGFACALLHALACDHEEYRQTIAQQSGIKKVAEAMRQCPRAANVQAWGCAALQSLACNSVENTRTIIGLSMEEFVDEIMVKHPLSLKLQEFGQMLLDTLAG